MKTCLKRLQECTTLADAEPILMEIKAGPGIRKLVETGVMLKNHPDKIQREYGASFLRAAIQEADMPADEEPTPHHGDAVKPKNENFVKEEELAGGDPSGTEGSEQSTDNTEPYPQVAKKSVEDEGMETATGEDQMKEGMPGQMPGMMPGMMPGLEPGIAAEMGNGMPQLPPMSTPQMMKQMQYTVVEALKRYVTPLRNTVRQQQEAIKILSKKVQESEAKNGYMKLDIDAVKQHSQARPMQETIPEVFGGPTIVQTQTGKKYDLGEARLEIQQMDKNLRAK